MMSDRPTLEIYWLHLRRYLSLAVSVAGLGVLLSAALLWVHRSPRIGHRLELPRWVVESAVYGDEVLIFGLGVAGAVIIWLGFRI